MFQEVFPSFVDWSRWVLNHMERLLYTQKEFSHGKRKRKVVFCQLRKTKTFVIYLNVNLALEMESVNQCVTVINCIVGGKEREERGKRKEKKEKNVIQCD